MTEPLLTTEDLAARLRLDSDNYVRENAKNWPHLVIAKRFRFTEAHVEQIVRLHEVQPATPMATRNTLGRRTRGGAA